MAEQVNIIVSATDSASSVLGGIGNAFGNLGSIITGIESALNLVGDAFRFARDTITPFVTAAIESEDAVTNLNATLRSMGDVTGLTSEQLQEMASGFQQVTRYSDESIINAEAMLLTFGNISGDVFPEAIATTLDLAAKFGSLDQASIMLGKALNDPVAGVTALRRVGVQLSETQEEQIKNFIETGDVAAAQGVILEELGRQVGGLAEAYGTTFAGSIEILKNRFGEIQEVIGRAFIPILGDLANVLVENMPALERLGQTVATWLVEFRESGVVQTFADKVSDLVGKIIGLADAFVDAGLFSSEFGESLAAIFGEENQSRIFALQDAFQNFFSTLQSDGLGPALRQLWTDIMGGGVDGETILQGFVDRFSAFLERTDWSRVGDVIASVITGVVETVLTGLDIVVNRIDWRPLGAALRSAFLEMFDSGLHDIDLAFVEWSQSVGRDIPAGIVLGLSNSFGIVISAFSNFVAMIITTVKRLFGISSPSTVFASIGQNLVAGLLGGFQGAWSGFVSTITSLVNNFVTSVGNVIGGILNGSGGGGGVPVLPGTVGGRDMTDIMPGGGGDAGGGVGGGGGIVQNFYGPVYMSSDGAVYDCPPINPVIGATVPIVGSTPGSIGGR